MKAAIFDLDGTLLDTLGHIAQLMNGLLEARAFPLHAADDYRFKVGGGIQHLAEQALPMGCRESWRVHDLARAAQEAYSLDPIGSTKPYPGVMGMLENLMNLGIPMAILSNKPQELTEWTVQAFFPHIPFRRVAGQKPGVPHKPDPWEALQILEEFGFDAQHVLLLGDSDIDMQTARRAGLFPVGAAWGFRGREELEDAGAARILTTPGELVELLLEAIV